MLCVHCIKIFDIVGNFSVMSSEYMYHLSFFFFFPIFIWVLSVIEAADVLQAWKILEDLRNHIDLVLTEVVMPYLSGIGLLCKIMSHKTRPNLPVISK